MSLHAVGLWQAAVGVIARQEAVLQVNHCLADLLITAQEIVVINRDFQVLVLGQETRHLKHPKENKRGVFEVDWILHVSFKDNMDYIIFSIASMYPFTAFTFQTQGWWYWVSNGLCRQSISFPVTSLCMDHTEQEREHNASRRC